MDGFGTINDNNGNNNNNGSRKWIQKDILESNTDNKMSSK